MSKQRIKELQELTARISKLDISKLSESQLAERNSLIKNIKEELTKIKEVSDTTLVNYLTKVDADSRKHPKDPTKRSPEKANKSVAGFSRAFNKLDSRKEQGPTEAFIAPGLSAANAAAEFRRQGQAGGGYRGRIDIPVDSEEDYLEAGRSLKHAAKQKGQHIEYGLSGRTMSVFSDSMNSDELDAFIDDVLVGGLGERVAEAGPQASGFGSVSVNMPNNSSDGHQQAIDFYNQEVDNLAIQADPEFQEWIEAAEEKLVAAIKAGKDYEHLAKVLSAQQVKKFGGKTLGQQFGSQMAGKKSAYYTREINSLIEGPVTKAGNEMARRADLLQQLEVIRSGWRKMSPEDRQNLADQVGYSVEEVEQILKTGKLPEEHGVTEGGAIMPLRNKDGLTQGEWYKKVKAKYPDANIVQEKRPNGRMIAMLPDGQQLVWSAVLPGAGNPIPRSGVTETSLADQIMQAAQAAGLRGRIAGTPEQERERTQQILAQRAKERQEQERQAALADVEKLPELKAKYEEMKKLYQSLGGSNWQYADREQNLTDAERKARSMEPELNRLAAQIHRAEKTQGVAEGMEDSPVASAITRRIMMQRVDLLSKYGPEKVLNAIEDVADFVGDVEEIGSSDVSGWVKQVERTLGDSTGVTTEAYDRLKKVFDFSNFKG